MSITRAKYEQHECNSFEMVSCDKENLAQTKYCDEKSNCKCMFITLALII